MNPNPTLDAQNDDALLTAFAQDVETAAATVADWSRRYPTLGGDFARVATDTFAGATPEVAPDDRLQAVLMNALRKQKGAYLGASAIVSLVDKERGITAARIAQTIALPLPYVAKLNQRLFRIATLPARLLERLADAVERSVEDVTAYLSQPPTLARGAAYRSDDAPTVADAEDFVAALRADESVSPETRDLYRENE
ncbi:MAG: hypothetical protein H7Y38_16295 [Armatimonadetes bacterium]|nr:hypothetical protein [Armatimonadota bacterium]